MAYGRCQEPRGCRWSLRPGGDRLVHLERFRPGITFESLADSGGARFRSLDMKLSTALGKILKTANNALSID
eukprot:5715678-Heterocapsa_arctica.AAC.1